MTTGGVVLEFVIDFDLVGMEDQKQRYEKRV
jgi:hypothetical protein